MISKNLSNKDFSIFPIQDYYLKINLTMLTCVSTYRYVHSKHQLLTYFLFLYMSSLNLEKICDMTWLACYALQNTCMMKLKNYNFASLWFNYKVKGEIIHMRLVPAVNYEYTHIMVRTQNSLLSGMKMSSGDFNIDLISLKLINENCYLNMHIKKSLQIDFPHLFCERILCVWLFRC